MSVFNLTLLTLTEILGDFKLKDFARTNSKYALAQGLLGYGGVIYFLIKSFRDGNVMYVNGMWDGMSGIINTLAAYIILGERLKNIKQYIGIIMICVGTFLLYSGGIVK